MILDYTNPGKLEAEYAYRKLTIDGREIQLAFFIDTERGIVKSYDVMGDNIAHHESEHLPWPDGVDFNDDRVAFVIITGNVDILEGNKS